ncbi:ParB/RepB/Spo0J family partition protein [Streptomyces violascens]|uniref:Plasmid partitioning protein n=1 Tax=Streptomyces violascens TaxID=67381 RepID=A0ABQ3QL32_9ACTN|nr:ParB/RepB/Spo0J family partition protein [Streptomyces violascens]GGU44812.1 plasmid partitioning protein [Streptomyces violascens]GHI37980.1 plasmid partitioning protein [Streptomyces violascens]
MTPPQQRVTRGFSIGGDGQDDAKPVPRRVRTRQQIMAGEGKRPPAAVELKQLAHNPLNPREELTEIDETAESLREKGQLQPIAVVRRAAFLAVHGGEEAALGDAEYVVIDGNRRLAAAKAAGLNELRIDVNDGLATSAADILESALIANIHRVDVAPLDQARAIQELLTAHGSQEKVAKRLGKSGAWVSQRLALLELKEDLQEKVESGELKVKDARRIGRLPADQQDAEAAATLNRVKAPRKPRAATPAREASSPAAPVPGQAALPQDSSAPDRTLNPVKATAAEKVVQDLPSDSRAADQTLNPVKTGLIDEVVPDLPWDSPAWFDAQLRQRMTAEHRDQLVLLLMADDS